MRSTAALDIEQRSAAQLRIALHTGDARVRSDGRYIGPALHTCERLTQIANAGQTLISSTTASMLAGAAAVLVDLGLHRLRDLSSPMRVFALDACRRSGAEPLRSLERVPNNLPVHLTSFVGRLAELAAAARPAARPALADHHRRRWRGQDPPGGAGRGRPGRALAGWCVVGRARLGQPTPRTSPTSSPARSACSSSRCRGPLRSLVVHARQRRMLICLDNCEQVLDGAAELADAVLRACPEVAILTTSREPLGVPGEAVWRVPPLASDDALALFVERAGVVRPWFTLDASSEAAVRTMCARLDGVPLALELAAAWLRTLTPRQIEAGLDDRFALLVRGPRGAVQRQQTLAASIDWSHALLDESDRIVLRRLAVLAGGFGLDAARAVCGAAPISRDDVLEALGRLVDKSLVVAEEARRRGALSAAGDHPPVRRRTAGRSWRSRGDARSPPGLLPGAGRSARAGASARHGRLAEPGRAGARQPARRAGVGAGGVRRGPRPTARRDLALAVASARGPATRASSTCGGPSAARRTIDPRSRRAC